MKTTDQVFSQNDVTGSATKDGKRFNILRTFEKTSKNSGEKFYVASLDMTELQAAIDAGAVTKYTSPKNGHDTYSIYINAWSKDKNVAGEVRKQIEQKPTSQLIDDEIPDFGGSGVPF